MFWNVGEEVRLSFGGRINQCDAQGHHYEQGTNSECSTKDAGWPWVILERYLGQQIRLDINYKTVNPKIYSSI